jgi:hypothetical protein
VSLFPLHLTLPLQADLMARACTKSPRDGHSEVTRVSYVPTVEGARFAVIEGELQR